MSDSESVQLGLRRATEAQQALDDGDPSAADVAARQAIAVFRREFGEHSPDVANLLLVASQAERLSGELDGAQASAREAVAIVAALPGGVHSRLREDHERTRAPARGSRPVSPHSPDGSLALRGQVGRLRRPRGRPLHGRQPIPGAASPPLPSPVMMG